MPGEDRGQHDELARVRRERDLYRQLLFLGEHLDLERFLAEALEPVVELIGASHGLLEIYDGLEGEAGRRWSVMHGLGEPELASVRTAISRGIIAQAIAGGCTIVTASAKVDPRFRERESVQMGRIDTVLCAPIGECPPLGVLYLQGRLDPGGFSEDDRQTAETFARHLGPIVRRLLTRQREQTTDPTSAARRRLRADGVVGRSRALGGVLEQVASVAPLDVTVLLTGGSGTGKSQIARVIHDNSPRATGTFVEVNCATLPEALVESELFGALPGAHSTATRRIEGKVAAADRGTLFLDEIGELPSSAQAKLLQLLHSKTFFPLGSSRPVVADVRVIAASNVDLEAAVAEHRFREDLFYRLQVLPIRMPGLAERREDIEELAIHFCTEAVVRHRLPALALSPGAVRTLRAMEWPGNLRQLEHAVEAAAIRAAGLGALQVEASHLVAPDKVVAPVHEAATFQEATRRFQAELVRETLEEHRWNVVESARKLDIARSHLYTLIRGFGLTRGK